MSEGTLHIERLRRGMREHGIEALVCLKPQSSFYLSGFNPIIYSHPVIAILPLTDDPILLVHALRDDHARQSAWVKDIRLYGAWSTKKTLGMDWLAALRAILEERGLGQATLGFDGDFLPLNTLRQMEQRLPGAKFVDASEIILHARMVKDPSEIEMLRKAAVLADIGMQVAIETAAQRKSEREISVAAMAAMNRAWIERFPDVEVADFASLEGGAQNGLWCYCLIGERVALNCDNPTPRVPVTGELGLIVIWTNCNGLHVENERTVAFGKLNEQRRNAFETVLQVRAEAQQSIRASATCADVYRAAKSVYERLGYGKYLPGRIGHGMGLGAHEHPSLGPSDEKVLEPGMVMTFEPNLRIPEFGGLQHSDTFVVNENGFEFLTTTERGLIQV